MAGGGTLQPGGGTGLQGKRTGSLRFTKFSNAYMLVYVREADWDRVMCNVDTTHIEPLLLQRLEVRCAEQC
jgi:ubiquitin carboxyl-terminal hydrolase 7